MTRIQKANSWLKEWPALIILGSMLGGAVGNAGYGLVTPAKTSSTIEHRVSNLEKGFDSLVSVVRVHVDSGAIKTDRRDRQVRSILVILCRISVKDHLESTTEDAGADCNDVLHHGTLK